MTENNHQDQPSEGANSISRREFLKWLLGTVAAAAAGYGLRRLLSGPRASRPGEPGTPTATATARPSPTFRPGATPTSPPGTATLGPTEPPTETPSPTPTPLPWVYPEGPSKLGLHTIRPNDAFPFVRSIAEAGATVALVKALGGIGLLREIKSVSPDTVTVGRANLQENLGGTGDPVDVATRIMQEHMTIWDQEREYTDYWEVLNEVSPPGTEGHVWLARFYIRAMEIAETNGYTLALFSYSTGVPEWRDWQAIVETGIFARAKAGGHILALHEYDWPNLRHNWGGSIPGQPQYDPDRGVLAGRYRHLYRDFLIPRDEVIPLAITECGLDMGVTGGEMDPYWDRRWIREMAWYDSKLVEDEYVLGAAIFTLGGADKWPDFDYEHLLPQLRDYILRQHRLYG